jgi:hypothetical protein
MNEVSIKNISTEKFAIFVVGLAICTIIVDTSLTKIYGYMPRGASYSNTFTIFGPIIVAYGFSQFMILRFTESKIKEIIHSHDTSHAGIQRVVLLTQCALTIILFFLFVEITIIFAYSSILVAFNVIASYSLAVFLLIILVHRFLKWFAISKNKVVVIYAAAIAVLATNAVLSLAYALDLLLGHSEFVRPTVGYAIRYAEANPYLSFAYISSSILSFVSLWFATVVTLKHYSRKLGPIIFWILVSLPLVYFLSQFQFTVLEMLSSIPFFESISFGMVSTLSLNLAKPLGALLFGITFWSVARSLTSNRIKHCLIIASCGIMLSFISNQAVILVNYPFPPFGLATVSFFGLSSYLIFIGIYYSAMSIAHDSDVRQAVRRSVEDKWKLLDNIGSAYMLDEINQKVTSLADKISEETGVEPSIEEDDMKDYIRAVIEETRRKKEEGKTDDSETQV